MPLISTRASPFSPRHHLIGNQLHLFAHFAEAAAHEALDRIDGIFRVGDGLTLSHRANQPLTALGECHDGRRGPAALLIRYNDGLAAFHDGHDGIGRSQVYAYDFAHASLNPPATNPDSF